MKEHPLKKNKYQRVKRAIGIVLMCCLLAQGLDLSALSVVAASEHQSDETNQTGSSNETNESDEKNQADSTNDDVEDIDVIISSDMKYAVANENELVFHVEATGGKDPLNKYYELFCDQELVEGKSLESDTITYMPQSGGTYTLRVSATDALGSTVGTEHTIPVSADEKEASGEWSDSIKSVTLTDDYAKNLVEVAKTQLGYEESSKNFIIDDNDEQKGYTRYGDWYGTPYGDWNALFVSFCINYAELPSEYSVAGADSIAWKTERTDLYIDNEDEYTPKSGDLIFFHDSENTELTEITDAKDPTNIGIIEKVDEEAGKLYTIEGDVDHSVSEQEYSISDDSIVGYVSIPTIENKSEGGEDESESEESKSENAESKLFEEKKISEINESMLSVTSLTEEDSETEESEAEEKPLVKLKVESKQDGQKGYKLSVSIDDWNGNASDNDKMTGVFEKKDENGDWVTVDEISQKKKGEWKYEATISSLEDILNTPYRCRFTQNNTTNTTYIKAVVSEEFYIADLIKDGFRKWALEVYPQRYNDGASIETLSGLNTAYEIYKDKNITLTVAPEQEENLLGNNAAFNISFKSSEKFEKNRTIQIDLHGDNGIDITDSGEVKLATSDLYNYISVDSISNGVITLTVLDSIKENTEIALEYSFKIDEGSTLGEHSLYGQVTYDSKKTGEDIGKYQITEPTSGWLLRSAELQTTGEILPKRADREGTQLTYKLTLTNYGDSARTLKKLEATWAGESLSEELLGDVVLPAATVTKENDTETRTPGTVEVTCSFEAPLSYESVESITFNVTDSIRDSKSITSSLKLKQDGTYWLVTGDSTVSINIDDADQATFGTISASVVDNLDERSNADININGKIQYFDEASNKWVTVTENLTSPTSGVFSNVNAGSTFVAMFDSTYMTVDDLLNTKYRFIANGANQKSKKDKIDYSTDDNAADINASQPFYLVDKLEKSGFRDWVLDAANGYDTANMSLNDLAEAYKNYSRLGLKVDVSSLQDGYEAGFDASFNLTLSAENALKSNSEIRIKLSDISAGMTSEELINFADNMSVAEDTTDYVQKLSVEGDEIVIRMAKMLPVGSALHLIVTSALEFADGIGAHTVSAHAVYREDDVIKLEDTGAGDLNVVSPGGWHIVGLEEPVEAVYPGDDVFYTITFQNFEDDTVTIPTEKIKALFGIDHTEMNISEYKDSEGNPIADNVVLPGQGTVSVKVKITSPVGNDATGTKAVQFSATDTEGKKAVKDGEITFANPEITIEPSITYDASTKEFTVKLVCKDLYGTKIDLHNLSWDSKDTEGDGNWKTIGTQTITPTGSGKNPVYVDTAEFILTEDDLAALEEKSDSSTILYRLKDTVSGSDYYSSPVYFDNLQDLKEATKLMVELADKIGYKYDEFMKILDYLYYDEVAKDSKVPFSDKNSLMQYLLQEYKDAGNDISAVVKIWKKYYTDMMDPNMSNRSTNHGSSQSEELFPVTKPQAYDWEDENMQYDKDENGSSSSPFHNVINSEINGMDEFVQAGGLYSGSYFSDLSKTAVADEAGDENKERNYTIDIRANADGTISVPTVVVFQIQTSWQMFDLDHANQVNGPKGSPCTVTDMATLYDIKHALIDFAEYMKENGDGSVCFAITDVEHAGTFSMINAPYFTNNMDNLISGLEQWDIFGNCEHVHYKSDAYVNAVKSITSVNFNNWKDGNGIPIFEDAKKVSVVIGGSTENSNGNDGYGCVTPDVGSTYLDYLYTIRCNSGTASPYLSWLDNTGMTNLVNKYNGIAFKDVTSREQLVSVFKSILQDVGKLGNVEAAKEVVLKDTVENEFELLTDSIQLVTYDFNGNPTETKISADDSRLEITNNSDGTTTIKYSAGTVDYGETVHLKFKVRAKENYIGSNNVSTNVGVPILQYKNDIYGSATAQMKFTDEPKVNVPVRYNIEDGGTKDVAVNTKVNLWDELSAEQIVGKTDTDKKDGIENWASGSGQNYEQINGTVSYQWERQKLDENGDPVKDAEGNDVYETIGDPASVHITNGQPDSDYPNLNTTYTPENVGTYKFRLKTIFDPDDKTSDWSETNDKQVESLVSYGYVQLNAKDNVVPVPTGTLAGGLMKWILGITAMLGLLGCGCLQIRRKRKTR